MRILHFKGAVNKTTIPKILEFREKLEKSGLPVKNTLFDGKKVTDVDPAAVAALLVDLKKDHQKFALINVPPAFKAFLETVNDQGKISIYESQEEAVLDLNKRLIRTEYSSILKIFRKNKALSLLVALVLFIIALPFFETRELGIIFLMFFTTVLLAGVYAVSYNLRHVAGGVFLAVPTLITAWSNVFVHNPQIVVAEMLFLTFFLIYTLSIILLNILSVRKVTINELYAAIAVYIMVGMAFGVVYALLYSLSPGSIAFPPEEKAPLLTAFFYFSFVSMSSTGFSGIIAVSSLARAVVVVQVVIGVMYISTLLGKLVSANTPDDDGLFDNMEQKFRRDVWSDELDENSFRKRSGLLILSMIMLNYSCSVLMTVLNLPFFMDSWGTSLAVILGGLGAGIIVGIVYNLIMAWTFWGASSWVWMFCNILIAVLTWFFYKRGWVTLQRPGRLLAAGAISGVFNSLAVMLTTYFSRLPTYKGTMVVYHFFVDMTGNIALASIAEKLAVEMADKSLSLALVAVALIFIRDFLNWNQKSPPQH